MKNKRKSNYQSADINIYCFPFVLNKHNEYLCFFRNENETKEFTTTKTQRVYQRAQSFIYECLKHGSLKNEWVEMKKAKVSFLKPEYR